MVLREFICRMCSDVPLRLAVDPASSVADSEGFGYHFNADLLLLLLLSKSMASVRIRLYSVNKGKKRS